VRLLALAAAGLAGPALAGPLPSQEGWDAARESVTVADGLNLAYVHVDGEEGVADDPLILLHGYTDNSRSWSLLIPHLGGREVYALDLRGHGGSEAPACCFGVDAMAHDVVGFMDAMGIERADVVGHSLGSMTAGVLAALHPERVDRLVLVSTALAPSPGASDWLWENVMALEAPIDPESQFMLDWYANPTPVDEAFLTAERTESAETSLATWRGVLASLAITDWTALARRVTAPTLVLWGDQDGLFGAAEQEAVRAALPAAAHETYEGLGHNMFWEEPEEVGARIAAFLDE
jgi:pimeloyl-ACP methyl ester carboxylesterase